MLALIMMASVGCGCVGYLLAPYIEVEADCPEPEVTIDYRVRACLELCGGPRHVSWFARNDLHSYICQCNDDAELEIGGLSGVPLRDLWRD